MRRSLYVGGIALLLETPALAQIDQKPSQLKQTQAQFISQDGKQLGSANLSETPNGVLIQVDLKGLPGGEHAFHIHETGKCDASDF